MHDHEAHAATPHRLDVGDEDVGAEVDPRVTVGNLSPDGRSEPAVEHPDQDRLPVDALVARQRVVEGKHVARDLDDRRGPRRQRGERLVERRDGAHVPDGELAPRRRLPEVVARPVVRARRDQRYGTPPQHGTAHGGGEGGPQPSGDGAPERVADGDDARGGERQGHRHDRQQVARGDVGKLRERRPRDDEAGDLQEGEPGEEPDEPRLTERERERADRGQDAQAEREGGLTVAQGVDGAGLEIDGVDRRAVDLREEAAGVEPERRTDQHGEREEDRGSQPQETSERSAPRAGTADRRREDERAEHERRDDQAEPARERGRRNEDDGPSPSAGEPPGPERRRRRQRAEQCDAVGTSETTEEHQDRRHRQQGGEHVRRTPSDPRPDHERYADHGRDAEEQERETQARAREPDRRDQQLVVDRDRDRDVAGPEAEEDLADAMRHRLVERVPLVVDRHLREQLVAAQDRRRETDPDQRPLPTEDVRGRRDGGPEAP